MNYLEMEKLARRLLMHYMAWRSVMDSAPQLQGKARGLLDGFTEAMSLMGIGNGASTIVRVVDEEYGKVAPPGPFSLAVVENREWLENLVDNLVRRLAERWDSPSQVCTAASKRYEEERSNT